MSFLTAESGYKKGRWIILRVSLSWQNKDEVLKPTDKSLITNHLVYNKCKCANEMSLLVFIKDFKQKSLIFLLL